MDFGGAMLVELIAKFLFSDVRPKGMVIKGIERREARRKVQEKILLEQQNSSAELDPTTADQKASSSTALNSLQDQNHIRNRNPKKSSSQNKNQR
jgi:hypothetical protein